MRKTKYAVELTEAERARLRSLIGSGTAPTRMSTHARILLKANQDEGGWAWTDAALAQVARPRLRAAAQRGARSAAHCRGV